MVSKLAARSRWSRGATPANDRSAASPLTRASVSVLASWLASWGAATGPDVGGFMAVLRDMGRFHGVQARRSSCPADGTVGPGRCARDAYRSTPCSPRAALLAWLLSRIERPQYIRRFAPVRSHANTQQQNKAVPRRSRKPAPTWKRYPPVLPALRFPAVAAAAATIALGAAACGSSSSADNSSKSASSAPPPRAQPRRRLPRPPRLPSSPASTPG